MSKINDSGKSHGAHPVGVPKKKDVSREEYSAMLCVKNIAEEAIPEVGVRIVTPFRMRKTITKLSPSGKKMKAAGETGVLASKLMRGRSTQNLKCLQNPHPPIKKKHGL